eukprot:3024462-Alexandrium_andersonii.AAC.1
MDYDQEVLWLSPAAAPPSAAQAPVCLATQCSAGRIPRLGWQAQSWPGELSVAIYVDAPIHSEAAAAERETVRATLERL